MSVKDILARFGSARVVADALGAKRETVKKWPQRGAIPSEYWLPLVQAGENMGVHVTLEELAAAHSTQVKAA